jgi:hypothetical protein
VKPLPDELQRAVDVLLNATGAEGLDPEETRQVQAASAVLVRHGCCPACVEQSHLADLLPRTPATRDNYGGRECPDCGEFFRTGDQEVDPGCDEPDTHSDADPGL